LAIEDEDVQNDYDYSSIKAQLTYDTRNDLFFPTSGQRSFGAVEHADTLLGGDVTLTRLTGGTRFFFRLAPSTVAGFRYSTGLIIPGEEEFTVPLAERFFNGGENTVRSFKKSELGPKDSSNDPAGGLAYNVISVELRQRLIGNFTGTLFADFGNVAPNRTRAEEGKLPLPQPISDPLRHAGRLLQGISARRRLRPAVSPAGRPGAVGHRLQPG
jgi:outer membrane protein assembly factor BamA